MDIIWKLHNYIKIKPFKYYLFNFYIWKMLSNINKSYNQLKLEVFYKFQNLTEDMLFT
jgi:hypothetical protein